MPKETAQTIRKDVRLTIRVPIGTQWDFMKKFGDTFKHRPTDQARPVDSYEGNNWGWIIKITISENDEDRFHVFCQNFFKKRGIQYQQ